MIEVVVEESEVVLVKKEDEDIIRVVEEMKKAEVRALRGDEWEIEEDLVLKEENVYVLKDKKLRLKVI